MILKELLLIPTLRLEADADVLALCDSLNDTDPSVEIDALTEAD